jgi:hypothetical protein
MITLIDTLYFNKNNDLDSQLEKIRTKYRNFVFNLRYILIETKYTHRLLKNKPYNIRKTIEKDPRVVIVETDLCLDPEIEYVPVIKNAVLYQSLMKEFDGYVAFHYSGPLEEIKNLTLFLRELNYCSLCSPENIYQIELYETDENVNFLYVKVYTDF